MTRRPNLEARRRILEAARELFAAGGYEAVSMGRVAARAGLKKANLFHYYPTKEALGVAVLAEAEGRYVAGVRALFADDDQDPVTAVRLLFARGTPGPRRSGGAACCLVGRLALDAEDCGTPVRRGIESCFAAWRAEIARFLGGWKRRGWFRGSFRPEEGADAVLALYEGGLLLARAAGGADPFEHAERAAVAVLVSWRA